MSVGVSWNKVLAKLGSDYKKPDAVTVIDREHFKSMVWGLPASDMLMVGRSTRRELARMGILHAGMYRNRTYAEHEVSHCGGMRTVWTIRVCAGQERRSLRSL